jgi:hypothetical protein
MAAVNPPWVAQGRADHPAQLYRMALAGVSGSPFAAGGTTPAGGVDPYFGQAMAITGLASMNVQVGTGLVYIPATTAWNGMYAGYNNASFNVSIAASSSTQYRRDYIVAQMNDPGDNTAAWNVVAVTGTFSSSAPGALPAIPANSIPLAIVVVTPNMTVTNAGGTVVDARVINGLKGVWPTTSSARPSLSCPSGTMWYEADTQSLGVIVAGAYRYINIAGTAVQDPWHNFNPLAAGWDVAVGGCFAKYRKTFDNECQLSASLHAISGGGGADSWTTVTSTPLPAGYRPATNHVFAIGASVPAAARQAMGQLLSTGHIQLNNVSTSATFAWFEARVPLDV